jgi:hypothetical protein
MRTSVIASEAKQSSAKDAWSGLLRRYAPRNDVPDDTGVGNGAIVHFKIRIADKRPAILILKKSDKISSWEREYLASC